MPAAIVLFGATGDLASRKLLPALQELFDRNVLPADIHLIALGRKEFTSETFREYVKDKIGTALQESLEYVRLDPADPASFSGLKEALAPYSERLFYLALPTQSIPQALQGLGEAGLNVPVEGGWSRVVVEKPFGTDQVTAQALDRLLCGLFSEESTYRLDHYLGKETVENILAFRFGNAFFEPIWNKEYIDHIQITVSEELGIEDRMAFYAATGALRDVVQNHIMQLVTLLTIEQPKDLSLDSLSDAKLAILKQVTANPAESVFGQYAGLPTEAIGNAETYAMTTFRLETERWAGVPIYIRTGKRMASRVTDIAVHFKPRAQGLFQSIGETGNILTFRIQPDEGIFLDFNVKVPNQVRTIQSAKMMFCYATTFHTKLADAYAPLFQAVLNGDRAVSLRSDVIEESWRIIDELLARRSEIPLLEYPVGSWGPEAAAAILSQAGRQWYVTDQNICNGIQISK